MRRISATEVGQIVYTLSGLRLTVTEVIGSGQLVRGTRSNGDSDLYAIFDLRSA